MNGMNAWKPCAKTAVVSVFVRTLAPTMYHPKKSFPRRRPSPVVANAALPT
jgi:hypothetical protein